MFSLHGSRIAGKKTDADVKGFAREQITRVPNFMVYILKRRGDLDLCEVNVYPLRNTPLPRNCLASV